MMMSTVLILLLMGQILPGSSISSVIVQAAPSTGGTAWTNVLQSGQGDGVRVRYKETTGLCESNLSHRSFSGYVTIPAGVDTTPFVSHLFFWFFESRNAPAEAPITLWLNGGPGLASANQAVSGHNGPCVVGRDGNTTVLNAESWTEVSNMLYMDQPVQTGFSYDEAGEGWVDLVSGVTVLGGGDAGNGTAGRSAMRKGEFASQNGARTVGTTGLAARGISRFLEIWFDEFKQYGRESINIWSQSYGGHFAPAIAVLLARRSQSACPNSPQPFTLRVHSVGIINGLIDTLVQGPFYTQYASGANPFGINAYGNDSGAALAGQNIAPCLDLGTRCERLQREEDPMNFGGVEEVEQACGEAFTMCWGGVTSVYDAMSGRNPFDIAHLTPDPFPPAYSVDFLNQGWVREALGAEVNFTEMSTVVAQTFVATGDFIRGYLPELASLLNAGVHVALINGDRDYRCNWLGGEAISLAINYTDHGTFAAAGYAEMRTNDSHTGGLVRQAGRLSFTRVFDAGHQVPFYQPATALAIFQRVLAARDVATGRIDLDQQHYATTGPLSVRDLGMMAPPPQPEHECYVRVPHFTDRCTEAEITAFVGGEGKVDEDGVFRL